MIRYKVATIDGSARFFSRCDAAVAFAASQAAASWTSPQWSVIDRVTDGRLLVSRTGVVMVKS